MPRQSAPTLHPSTQLIGKSPRRPLPSTPASARVRAKARAGHLESPVRGSRQRRAPRADSAVLFTGTPCGPFDACRVASRPTRASGVTVWPIVVSTIAPMPARRRRTGRAGPCAGIAGGGDVPALLWASGFSLQGISVSTSASASLACRPYLMSGSLIADVQQDRADDDVAEVAVRGGERPRPGVPVQGVEEAGRQLHQRRGDEHEDREPLERVRGRPDGRPAEQVRVDRPELDQQQRDGGDAGGDVQALRDPVGPHRAAPARAATTTAGTGSGSASRSRSRPPKQTPAPDRAAP